MTVYKVPQDVEADDKLLGPFSFRQFIYLIAAVLAIAAAWGLGKLFIPLAIIPMPIIVFFGALALPLRKDQPMEVYLAAIVSFYLKPRKHIWQADGITSLIEITTPKVTETQRTKDLSQSEAERRLSYLANLVDSGGWSARGVATDSINSSMNTDVYYAAQQTVDVFDNSGAVNQNISSMIEQNNEKRRQNVINQMHQQANILPQPVINAVQPTVASPFTSASDDIISSTLKYDPYPTINQFVIQPLSSQPAQAQPAPTPTPAPTLAPAPPTPQSVVPVQSQPKPPQTTVVSTSIKPVSPDIINLANQNDLSIQTIAHEANRLREKELQNESAEVVISLR